MTTDYYELLGVSPGATAEEIKRAYRRRARELHPDANPDDPGAEARFKELAQVYEVLSDPQRRRRYDAFGPEPAAGEGVAGGGLGDIFEAFFGGSSPFGSGPSGSGRRGSPGGADLEGTVEIDFRAAVFGTEENVVVRTAAACETCEATGARPGTSSETCSECGGSGQVRRVRQSILGQMVSAGACGSCGGSGQVIASPCDECSGEGRVITDKTYTVDIPAGVDTGSTLRLTGRGAVGPRGGPAGDLYVHVEVADDEVFGRQGDDLTARLVLSPVQAALGARVPFETLDAAEELDIARGTQSGRRLRLRGLGVPHVTGRGRGDLIIEVVVETPTDLSVEEEALLREWAEVRGDAVKPPDSSLVGKLRSAFK